MLEKLELLKMVEIEKVGLLEMVGIEKLALVDMVGIEKPRLLQMPGVEAFSSGSYKWAWAAVNSKMDEIAP
ncbi:hypothetical protein Pyn_22596 [Prunus yedoensis var. nudiflora]|uniref:Uncharacterized protein n=1 Tax=Prunus yedoensis var. nudiflora TaxID=2094558 RepID=A0A314ZID9_PRUYE|nr:hypothetical protein Pyn_22596 [Prunus yedoensis var. nudiflora]